MRFFSNHKLFLFFFFGEAFFHFVCNLGFFFRSFRLPSGLFFHFCLASDFFLPSEVSKVRNCNPFEVTTTRATKAMVVRPPFGRTKGKKWFKTNHAKQACKNKNSLESSQQTFFYKSQSFFWLSFI